MKPLEVSNVQVNLAIQSGIKDGFLRTAPHNRTLLACYALVASVSSLWILQKEKLRLNYLWSGLIP